ncbi:MAG: two-component sensor histidine kinase [Methanobacteriaceae archaeon]|jgi:two-component system sensor kinase|nr:two-component sensor histidine kinase [Methanobacteriaceae archaeon]
MTSIFKGRTRNDLFIVLLLFTAVFLIYYLNILPVKNTFFNQLLLFPLVLATSNRKRFIWSIPIIIGLILIIIQPIFSTFGVSVTDDLFRLILLMVVILMVALLVERIEKVRSLRSLNDKLKKQTKMLEDANEELEAFAYSVSHDLRVPLRAIDGFSRIIVEDYQDKLDEEGIRLLNIVRENTHKMGQLIDDILMLSRASRQEMKMSKIDMVALVNNVYDEVKQGMEDRNIELKVGSLPNAYGDRALLSQVLSNLLSNSIKFTSNQEKGIIEVGYQDGVNENIYYVRDNGAGFDMKYVNKLFGLFQRLHGPEEFEGTGVGLSIVQRIIRRHEGRVWGEGEVDKGATIYFTLPK